ncbi:Hypothetical predicted protein [Octopus vulgaris]|uniref:ADP-ribosylation factor-like protein 6-interacting protein 4 n=1 Tax=Octopus vulgaris TaxID=6645 RepID=A0AA36AH59_OCTVU|nr:Hypothetical predicted protein [Octopus vulgaris]
MTVKSVVIIFLRNTVHHTMTLKKRAPVVEVLQRNYQSIPNHRLIEFLNENGVPAEAVPVVVIHHDSSEQKKKHKKHKKEKKKKKKKKKKHKKLDKSSGDEKVSTGKEDVHSPLKTTEKVTSLQPASKVKESMTNEHTLSAPGPSPRILKPMTKEEWEKQQSVIRRVYDPTTGRNSKQQLVMACITSPKWVYKNEDINIICILYLFY